jgi:hypothetical protein
MISRRGRNSSDWMIDIDSGKIHQSNIYLGGGLTRHDVHIQKNTDYSRTLLRTCLNNKFAAFYYES